MPIDIEKDDVQTALKKLKAREESFQQVEKINKLGSWEVDLITHKSIWLENSYNIYGLKPFSIQPNLETFLSYLLPEYVLREQLIIKQLLTSHEVTTFKAKIHTETGKIKDVLLNAQAIYDENDTAIKLIGSTQDITQ